MRVSHFPNQCAQNSTPVVQAVIDSLRRAGHTVEQDSLDADAVIVWSVLWHGRMAANQKVYQHYRAQNKPVIVLDIGALYRGQTWKIAVNNITADGYYGHTENLDMDRPRRLQISLATPVHNRSEIIIAAQHRASLQVESIPDIELWILEQYRQLRQVTDRPIVVRPHPRCALRTDLLPKGVMIETPNLLANTYDSFDMHFDCHAVVNYNSGPGIQAAISGCRPVVDKTSLASPVGVNIADIEKPYTIDRDQWLVEICHTEYTLAEIQTGIWINRLLPALN